MPAEHEALGLRARRPVADSCSRFIGFHDLELLNAQVPPPLSHERWSHRTIHRHTSSDTLSSATRCQPGADQQAFPGEMLSSRHMRLISVTSGIKALLKVPVRWASVVTSRASRCQFSGAGVWAIASHGRHAIFSPTV